MRKDRLYLFFLMFFLSSCVTTETSEFSKKGTKEQEVENRVNVAVALLQENQPETAMINLKAAMEVLPESPRVHEVLALTLERLGDAEKVQEHFEKMIKYDPSYTRGRANYGSYLMREEKYEEAKKHFLIVIKDVYYPNRATVYYQLGLCAEKTGQLAELEKFHMKAITIDPRFAPSLLELAVLKFKNQDYPMAQKYLDDYRANVEKVEAKYLLLGIKLSRKFKDKDGEGSYILSLKNLYPKSKEYLEYLDMTN